jgi:hypothetical protein
MGERVEASALVVGHDAEVHRRLERCVAALQRMIDGGWFVAHEDTIGMEVELDLVDPMGQPRLVNDAVLERLCRADMQHELGQFSVELNLAPRRLQGRVLGDNERDLADVLDRCRVAIEGLGVRLVAVRRGRPDDFEFDQVSRGRCVTIRAHTRIATDWTPDSGRVGWVVPRWRGRPIFRGGAATWSRPSK